MRVDLYFNRGKLLTSSDGGSPNMFYDHCHAVISKVGKNTRKGTEEACKDIMTDSISQVPVATGALASTGGYKVEGSYKTGWTGELAYGSRTGLGVQVNPQSGKAVDKYMTKVHENLYVRHKIGKAKFLEDPIRTYGRAKFPRTIMRYLDLETVWGSPSRHKETEYGRFDWMRPIGARIVVRGTSSVQENSTSTYKDRNPNAYSPYKRVISMKGEK